MVGHDAIKLEMFLQFCIVEGGTHRVSIAILMNSQSFKNTFKSTKCSTT